jgi:hypothetical protein
MNSTGAGQGSHPASLDNPDQPLPGTSAPARDHPLAVMMYVRFPLSLRNVEDLLHERGIEVSHETVRFWGLRLGRCSHPSFGRSV